MKTILGILIGIALAFGGLWVANTPSNLFGSTVTTINGSDTLSNSRTTINTNLANLNATKAEISDVSGTTTLNSLAKVGTITQGVWNATAITALYGGTGSTTLSSGQVLLGNGTGALGVVNGFGTSGMFLTSNGNAAAPTWQSSTVNQAGTYTWTGLHTFNTLGIIDNASSTFNATTTIAASSATNKALVLNSVAYAFPSTQGTANQFLSNNGSGVLSWALPSRIALATSTYTYTQPAQNVDLSLASTTIPGNTLGSGTVHTRVFVSNIETNEGNTFTFKCFYGGSVVASAAFSGANLTTTYAGTVDCWIFTNASTGSEIGVIQYDFKQNQQAQSATAKDYLFGQTFSSAAVDSTANQTLSITWRDSGVANAATTITSSAAIIEKTP